MTIDVIKKHHFFPSIDHAGCVYKFVYLFIKFCWYWPSQFNSLVLCRLKSISSQEFMGLKLAWSWKLFTQWSHQLSALPQSLRAWVPTTFLSPPTTRRMYRQLHFVAIVTRQGFSLQDGVPGIKLICPFLQVSVTWHVILWFIVVFW